MQTKPTIEWKIIKDSFTKSEVGALCIVDGQAVAVASFIDDKDGNNNGEVTFGEKFGAFIWPISLKGRAAAYVATQAYADPSLLVAHPELYNLRGTLVARFGASMAMDAIYAVYFKRPVGAMGTGVAKKITADKVKAFAIRKGFEKTVKGAFEAATKL